MPGPATPPSIRLSCVIPAYNEAANLPPLLQQLARVLDSFGHPYEVIVVDDGSRDDTAAVMDRLCAQTPQLRVLHLSRNFGKEAALTAGLDHADGDAVILLDADLQHDPALIGTMLQHWLDGAEMVYAVRQDRHLESSFKRAGTHWFYRLINRGARFEIPADAGDFRLLDRKVVEVLRRLPETHRFMKGLYAWAGFRTVALPYTPDARGSGQSHFGPWKLMNFAIDGITAFSTWPLRVVTTIGLMSALLAFLYGAWIVGEYLVRGNPVSGWSTLIVCILLFSGLQMVFLGVLGEYIGRIFEEVKRRPIYVIAREQGAGLPRASRHP